jgi:O-methyltransferase
MIKIMKSVKSIIRNFYKVNSENLEQGIVKKFINSECGRDYGINSKQKEILVNLFRVNQEKMTSGTSYLIHVKLADVILSISPDIKGDIIECGCWKGASTVSLSLISKLVGRRLLVCDSFEGLPDEGDQLHIGMHFGNYGYYKKGMFCGSIDEVKRNVELYGDVNSCEFIQGYFKDSLKVLKNSIAFAFIDVDLVDSTYDCLKYIWPLLAENGDIYTDDAGDMDVVRCFFNDDWWKSNHNCKSPGYVGSGCGLPLGMEYSSLGYAKKILDFDPNMWKRSDFLYYPEES